MSRALGLVVTFLFFLGASTAEAQVSGDLACISGKMCPDTFTYVYSFSNLTAANGFTPSAPLTLGDDGNLYGTTRFGGNIGVPGGTGYGTVFRLSPGGAITTLHAFNGNTEGAYPLAQLTKGPDGAMWGITSNPTSVFKVAQDGTFTSFGLMPYWAGEGANQLCFGSDGNLYGTLVRASFNAPDSFFQFTPAGVATMLYTFTFSPAAVVPGSDGYFYGTNGTSLYQISPSGDYTPIPVNSSNGIAYKLSVTQLLAASDGYFYGVGTNPGNTIYQIDTSGNLNVVLDLSLSYVNGLVPPLVEGSDGAIYGMGNAAISVTPDGTLTTLNSPSVNDLGGANLASATGYLSGITFGPGGLYGVYAQGGTACLNAAPQTCSLNQTGGIFVLSAASASAQGPGGGTPPSMVTLSAVDPNNDTLRSLLPQTPLGNQWDNSSYQAFADYQMTVSALVADGVTPLVVRWHFPQPSGNSVTFSLSDPVCASTGPQTCQNTGMFLCLDPFDCNQDPNNPLSVTVTPQPLGDGTYMAFALFEAPIDFVRPSQADADAAARNRIINVTATLGSSDSPQMTQTLPLTLWRPPVALLHGIWSNRCTWNLGLQRDLRFIVWAEDYEPTNSLHYASNASEPRQAIANALKFARGRYIAATQADFVGHSMGGLLGRLYASNAFMNVQYMRPDNLGYGDMHKYISLDTPHLGSALANALVDQNNNATDIGSAFQGAIEALPVSAPCNPYNPPSSLLPPYCIICGAVQDLSVGSIALSGMPGLDVPSHVIVGRGGVEAMSDISAFLGGMGVYGPIALGVATGVTALESAFSYNYFGNDDHDVIVSAASQTGIIVTNDQVSYLDTNLPSAWAVHFTVTGEDQTNTLLVNLLNAPLTNSDVFAPLPGTPATNASPDTVRRAH